MSNVPATPLNKIQIAGHKPQPKDRHAKNNEIGHEDKKECHFRTEIFFVATQALRRRGSLIHDIPVLLQEIKNHHTTDFTTPAKIGKVYSGNEKSTGKVSITVLVLLGLAARHDNYIINQMTL